MKTGVQKFLVLLDSGVRRNDEKRGFPTSYEFINIGRLKKIGFENQRILLEVRDNMFAKVTAEANGESERLALEGMKKAGIQIVSVTPETVNRLVEKYGKPIRKATVEEDMAKSNLPTKEVLDAVLQFKQKYGAP